MRNLVSTDWLQSQFENQTQDLVVLDASWHLPTAGRSAKAEFLQSRIPTAQFFDIDALSARDTSLPHMLPNPEDFASDVGKLGVSNSAQVICYDTVGLFSAARCWWMFKIFGHDKVAVLDGGLKKWLAEGRSVENTLPLQPQTKIFTSRFHGDMVANMQNAEKAAQIADARSPTRFRGEEAEPRPGVKPGHIPGARNVHYASLLNADGTLRPHTELAKRFTDSGIDTSKQVVTSCGSGVTAAILSLALTELGAKNHQLYDGSWTEWGASDQPHRTGGA
jgi:thiosulfate/3-mercaptopyruvate sulfurtransferase